MPLTPATIPTQEELFQTPGQNSFVVELDQGSNSSEYKAIVKEFDEATNTEVGSDRVIDGLLYSTTVDLDGLPDDVVSFILTGVRS